MDQAARQVGIAKKTLDDYFNHLRIAVQYNFNVERFKGEKIGILRRFVRATKERSEEEVREAFAQWILDDDTDKYWVDFDHM